MKFRTEVDVKPFDAKIGYGSRLFAIGSCFADNMSAILKQAKFHITANPTGVLFNPASIANTIQRLEQGTHVTADQLNESNGIWFCYDFHGSFSAATAGEALEKMNTAIDTGAQALAESDCAIITLGTAWVYELKGTGRVVANCHKQPSSGFVRRRLGVDEIVGLLSPLMEGVLKDKHVIFTVSPVRHLGDGADENFLSKATLKLAVAEIVNRYTSADYFPAYEILNDDLRDYRFYADDLVHPSAQALAYIREKFTAAAMTAETVAQVQQIGKIVDAASHRPLNAQSEAFRTFCRRNIEAINAIGGAADLTEERRHFESFL